jgi:hypothetical protein
MIASALHLEGLFGTSRIFVITPDRVLPSHPLKKVGQDIPVGAADRPHDFSQVTQEETAT